MPSSSLSSSRLSVLLGVGLLWSKLWALLYATILNSSKPVRVERPDVDLVVVIGNKKKRIEIGEYLGGLGVEIVELKGGKGEEARIVGVRASAELLISTAENVIGMEKLDFEGKLTRFCSKQAKMGRFGENWETREFFSSSERSWILLKAIQENGTASKLLIENESHQNISIFPLHERAEAEQMLEKWFLQPGEQESLLRVRKYFGSSIGFYFGWLVNYTNCLFYPALFSVIGALLLQDHRSNVAFHGLFALFLSAQSSFMQHSWLRKMSRMQWNWNVNQVEELEVVRADFQGTPRISPVTGLRELYFPQYLRYIRYAVTMLVSLFGASLLGFMFFKMFEIEEELGKSYKDSYIIYVPTIVYVLVLPYLTQAYNWLSLKLNHWENHRTDASFENALIIKLIFFQFLIYYSSLFYLLFWKFDIERLQDQLGIVFLLRQIINNVVEVGLPLVSAHFSTNSLKKNDDVESHQIESKLTKYEGTFDDYLEMVIQFGYIYMFGWAYPLVSFFSFLNNLIEVRSDMYKLTKTLQRPLQKDSPNIGPWHDVVEFMSVVGVVTNMSYLIIEFSNTELAFAFEFLASFSTIQRIGLVIAIEHIILAAKAVSSRLIPTVPEDIRDAKARLIFESLHKDKGE
jgi:hypothetical protein